MATAPSVPSSLSPDPMVGPSHESAVPAARWIDRHALHEMLAAVRWPAVWSACRLAVLAAAAGLPVLSVSAHVFGVASMYWTARHVCLPAAALATLVALGRSREAALARFAVLAGLVAVSVYDATRLPFVLSGIWGDFIPQVGGWVAGSNEPNALLGYLWRYIGDGGGIAIFFVLACALLGVRRHLVVLGVCYGVFVWSGLIGTIVLAANGPTLLFRLTPFSIALSLTGHLVYGSVLGWLLAQMLRRDPSLVDLPIRSRQGLAFTSSTANRREEPADTAGRRLMLPSSTPVARSTRIIDGTSEPVAFNYDAELATALNELSGLWWEVGRHDEALAATAEGVEIQRHLVSTNLVRYGPVLAESLNRVVVWTAGLGRYPEALSHAEEKVSLYRRLRVATPVAARPDAVAPSESAIAGTPNPDTQALSDDSPPKCTWVGQLPDGG